MTEEQAKTRWCPQTRNFDPDVSEVGCTCNRYRGRMEATCLCIASDCAMWVWDKEVGTKEKEQNGRMVEYEKITIGEGHCGLIRP